MKRIVWIISEGSPGHISQSEGLVAALARRIDLESTVIQTRPKLNGFARKLVRLWMGNRGLPDPFITRWLRCGIPDSEPDLIVTSGGKAVFAARSLALKTGAPLVFLGERKPYPSGWFHTVFTPSPFERDENDVPIEMIPTTITPEVVTVAAGAWNGKPQGPLWAMLIGGASASHQFTDTDWRSLGEQMNALAAKHGIRWLVSTSRRTGAPTEDVLRRSLDPKHVAYAVWWAEKPEKKMAAFLGAAQRIFVTQDSVTMVTEAVASGRPVVVTMPAATRLKPTSFLDGYFTRLESNARIVRLPIPHLANYQPVTQRPSRICPPHVDLANELLSRLPWVP